jgi:hypothetical protein
VLWCYKKEVCVGPRARDDVSHRHGPRGSHIIFERCTTLSRASNSEFFILTAPSLRVPFFCLGFLGVCPTASSGFRRTGRSACARSRRRSPEAPTTPPRRTLSSSSSRKLVSCLESQKSFSHDFTSTHTLHILYTPPTVAVAAHALPMTNITLELD